MPVRYPIFIQSTDDNHFSPEISDPVNLDPSNFEINDVLSDGYHGWDSAATYYRVRWDRNAKYPYLEKVNENDIEGFQAAIDAAFGTKEERDRERIPESEQLAGDKAEEIQYNRLQSVLQDNRLRMSRTLSLEP